MKKYLVVAEVTISVHTEVFAESSQETLAIADDRPLMGLCHQCANGEPEQEWVTSGELDGEPRLLSVEDLD